MPNLWKKLHLSSALALGGQLIGLTDLAAKAAPDVGAVVPHLGLPPHWAAVLTTGCTFILAFSRAIHAGDKMEVPKPR